MAKGNIGDIIYVVILLAIGGSYYFVYQLASYIRFNVVALPALAPPKAEFIDQSINLLITFFLSYTIIGVLLTLMKFVNRLKKTSFWMEFSILLLDIPCSGEASHISNIMKHHSKSNPYRDNSLVKWTAEVIYYIPGMVLFLICWKAGSYIRYEVIGLKFLSSGHTVQPAVNALIDFIISLPFMVPAFWLGSRVYAFLWIMLITIIA